MNTRTHKTRLLCGAIALGLLNTTGWAVAQTASQADTLVAPVAEMPGAKMFSTVETSPTQSASTIDSERPAAVNAHPRVTSDAPPDLSQPPLSVTYSRAGFDGSQTKEVMDGLRVVRQQATKNHIGQQVALNAALILLTGGLTLNLQSFSKNDLTGIEPEDAIDKERLKNPALLQLPAEVQRLTTQWLKEQEKTREMKFARPLVVNSAAWRLVYNTLDEADTTYKLKFDVAIYKDRESSSFFTGYKRAGRSCSQVSEARSIGDWRANDYQAVVDWAPQAVTRCAHEFIAQLPHLLELK